MLRALGLQPEAETLPKTQPLNPKLPTALNHETPKREQPLGRSPSELPLPASDWLLQIRGEAAKENGEI